MLGHWLLLPLSLSLVMTPALAQQAGSLVSAQPMPNAPAGMQAWRITYGTTDENGRAITATGIVAAPTGPTASRIRPVIAWTHGAWGVAQRCAPSLNPAILTLSPAL
ncbi:MAG TPA: hypothetical protein VF470_04435, partial [Sphingomicrobium sp.]